MGAGGRHLCGVLLLLALCASPRPVRAAAIIWVGDGTPESCTEAALRDAVAYAALNGGRTVKFNCGEDPLAIALTDILTLPTDTALDGAGLITLSGYTGGDVVVVNRNSTVELKGLAFSLAGGPAGWALANDGTTTIKDSTFSSNFLAVRNAGSLTVMSSTFSQNGCFICPGAIWNEGTLVVQSSLFSHNECGGGGGILNSGTLSVANSTFADNVCDEPFGAGGGIVNTGTALVERSSFYRNHGGQGGAVANSGTLTVRNALFDGNGAAPWGGAIYNSGSATIVNTMLSNSYAGNAGGSIFNAGNAAIMKSELLSSFAGQLGGGIFNAGVLAVSNSSIQGNSAGVDGGGIYSCGGEAPPFPCSGAGSLDLTNSVVTGNAPNDIVP